MFTIRAIHRGLRHAALLFAGLATAAPALGQAAAEPTYDLKATTELRGVIAMASAIPGGNAVVLLDTADGNRWTVTLGKASELRSAGITALSLAPGTSAVVTGNPSVDANEHRLLAQKVTLSDGKAWTRPPG